MPDGHQMAVRRPGTIDLFNKSISEARWRSGR